MQAQAAMHAQAAAACWRDTLAEELRHTEDRLAQAAAAAVDPSSVETAVEAAACAQRAEQAAEARAVRSALATELRVLEARLAAGAGAAAAQLAEQRAELEQLRTAHQKEIDDLVKSSNRKYSDMLAQRLDEEDKLRAQLEKNNMWDQK